MNYEGWPVDNFEASFAPRALVGERGSPLLCTGTRHAARLEFTDPSKLLTRRTATGSDDDRPMLTQLAKRRRRMSGRLTADGRYIVDSSGESHLVSNVPSAQLAAIGHKAGTSLSHTAERHHKQALVGSVPCASRIVSACTHPSQPFVATGHLDSTVTLFRV